MLGFKQKPLTEGQIRADLSALAPQIAAADDTVAAASEEALNGGNERVYDAAVVERTKLTRRRDQLLAALPLAIKREAEEAAERATAKEKADAAAAQAARETTYNGSVKITGAMARGLASVADPASLMAKAVADIIKSAESWLLKIPENVPWCSEHANVISIIKQYVADEIATAFDRYDITLPRGEVVEQPISQQGKELKRKLDDFARRTILERERYRPPEPERPHQIVRMLPYRPARRVAIRGEKGVAPPAFVFDPIIGDLRATTGEEKRDAIEHGAILSYEDLAAVGDPDHPEGGYVKVYLDEGAPAAANPVPRDEPSTNSAQITNAELIEELARERAEFDHWHRSTLEPLVTDELSQAIPATPQEEPATSSHGDGAVPTPGAGIAPSP